MRNKIKSQSILQLPVLFQVSLRTYLFSSRKRVMASTWSLGDAAGKARRLYSYLQAVYYAKPYNQLPHTAEHRSRVSAGVSSSSVQTLLVFYFCLSLSVRLLLSLCLVSFVISYIYDKATLQVTTIVVFLCLFSKNLILLYLHHMN